MRSQSSISVLFVCLGNICRSPTAHGVFEQKVSEAGLSRSIQIDSAGTASWHTGKQPDGRSMAAASQRGYDLSHLRARQAVTNDFDQYDYILAMDAQNLSDLQGIQPSDYQGRLGLFLEYADPAIVGVISEVPDPYHGGDSGFEQVLDLVESASIGLLEVIRQDHPEIFA